MTMEERKQRFLDTYVASAAGTHVTLIIYGKIARPPEEQQDSYFCTLNKMANAAWDAHSLAILDPESN